VGSLADNFNRMAEALERRQDEAHAAAMRRDILPKPKR
jgi:hypothetical protein